LKVLFDTSVLVAGLIESHPDHERAFSWIHRSGTGEIDFLVAGHSLAELYAVLTRLPVSPKISPIIARRLIRESIEAAARIITLSSEEYLEVLTNMAELNLAGGIIYDALIAAAAKKSDCDMLLTLNKKDFLRVWPEKSNRILEP